MLRAVKFRAIIIWKNRVPLYDRQSEVIAFVVNAGMNVTANTF